MKRADDGIGFLLRYENVAWYENGSVRILDRRIYPIRTEYVTCRTYHEVAQAIADMVTQSGGPYLAAAMGMALAAYEGRDLSGDALIRHMEDAAYTLSHARPTTAAKMERITSHALSLARTPSTGAAPLTHWWHFCRKTRWITSTPTTSATALLPAIWLTRSPTTARS